MASLFWHSKPYDTKKTDKLFVKKVKQNMLFQYKNCTLYRELIEAKGWNEQRIIGLQNVEEIPFIPTLYVKHHKMDSVPEKKMVTRATSSGTGGNKSDIGYDFTTLWRALGMSLSIGKKHGLISLRPCRYIVLGYQPRNLLGKSKVQEKAVAKTAYAFTMLAPAVSRVYAMPYRNGEYILDLESLKKALIKYSKGKTPVRLMGFPFHAYWLLTQLKEEGIRCPLPKGSVIAFGGGWKEYYTQKADKETMYELVEEILGIPSERCWEFYGAVEHPILYTTCKNHHFHVPIHSRVIIRNVDDFHSVANGTPGLVNLITPMIQSAPLLSVMTDDLGILHDPDECGCGICTPYLEILGRVGMADITTCAAGAEQLSQKIIMEGIK